jgi:hypothetical protein
MNQNGGDKINFHKPKVDSKKTPLTGGGEAPEIIIDSYSDSDVERSKIDIFEQIDSTVSEIQSKLLFDNESIYFRLDLKSVLKHPVSSSAIKALSGEILGFLDSTQRHLLIAANPSNLTNITRKSDIKKYVRLVRPMNKNEQLLIQEGPDRISCFIHLVPNIADYKSSRYLTEIQDYLLQNEYFVTYDKAYKLDLLRIETSRNKLDALIRDINYIYCIESIQPGVLNDLKVNHLSKVTHNNYTSEDIVSNDNLPLVVVMDTGLNEIDRLSNLIEFRDQYKSFNTPDDDTDGPHGHGTPISHLVIFGDGGNIPRAKIGSYKIYSPMDIFSGQTGIIDSIEKYSDRSRLFVSSINFTRNRYNENIFRKINKLIQEKNLVVAFSAGNITNYEGISLRSDYPSYLSRFPIDEPGCRVSIVSVGSIVKKPSDIAQQNMPSPFSKTGHALESLFKCPKPEVAYHGGNLDSKLSSEGLGVFSVDKQGKSLPFTGTSFSSPQFIGVVADIERVYGKQIANAETLKAISIVSSKEIVSEYVGFGDPKSFTSCTKHQALWVFEGNLPFPYTEMNAENKKYRITRYHDLYVEIPYSVVEITLCIVHSDNYNRNLFPSLNTFLAVEAQKQGNISNQTPIYVSNEKSHIKIFRWRYKKKRMGGTWRFRIFPNYTEYVLSEYRREILVRYGCAILLEAEDNNLFGKTLTSLCREAMERYSIQ